MHAYFPGHADAAELSERNSFLCKYSAVFEVVQSQLLLSKIVWYSPEENWKGGVFKLSRESSQRDGSSIVALQDLNF